MQTSLNWTGDTEPTKEQLTKQIHLHNHIDQCLTAILIQLIDEDSN